MKTLLHFCVLISIVLASCTAGYQSSKLAFDEISSEKMLQANGKLAYSLRNKVQQYNVYIDNSYSMNGYFNGSTPFLSTVNSLVTNLNNVAEDRNSILRIYNVNNQINFIGSSKTGKIEDHLVKMINFFEDDKSVNRGFTDIKDIFSNIIDSVKNNNVNIVITDGISSPGFKGQQATMYLDILQNSIYSNIYKKLGNCDFSTAVLKCNSSFNGLYINQLNQSVKCDVPQRPYYIIIFGNENEVQRIASLVKNDLRTSQCSQAFMLTNSKRINVKSKLLISPDYELVDIASNLKIRKTNKESGNLRVKVLLDLKGIPVDEEFLLNPENYDILPSGTKLKIDKLNDDNDPAHKGFTHKMLLVSTNITNQSQISVKLKFKQPTWVMDSSINQDINLNANDMKEKTYGLAYLVNGFTKGYEERKLLNDYFSFKIQMYQ